MAGLIDSRLSGQGPSIAVVSAWLQLIIHGEKTQADMAGAYALDADEQATVASLVKRAQTAAVAGKLVEFIVVIQLIIMGAEADDTVHLGYTDEAAIMATLDRWGWAEA